MLLSDGNACQKIRVKNVNGSSVAKRSHRAGRKLAATWPSTGEGRTLPGIRGAD